MMKLGSFCRVCRSAGARTVRHGRALLTVEVPDIDHKEFPDIGMDGSPAAGFNVIVERDACKEASKLAPNGKNDLPILKNVLLDEQATNVNGSVYLGTTDLRTPRKLEVPKIDGNFPNWEDVMPKLDGMTTPAAFHFDAGLMIRLLTAMQRVRGLKPGKDTLNVRMTFDGAPTEVRGEQITHCLKPMLLEVPGNENDSMTAAIMPMRGFDPR